MVGGELTLEGLDLVFNDVQKFYEAPFQVKSNGGILLIDDFGRQQVRPRDLLNRWIVPLENRVDYLTLHTGAKVEIPFDVLVVFSTNLPPRDLVDEAFMRRLRHKIEIGDPSYEEYREIFRRVAQQKGIPERTTPTELASLENKHVSHVSRALAELRAQGLIEPVSNLSRERKYRATIQGLTVCASLVKLAK